ncbi:type II secretion system protein [bacterium]|nr:type II secretion system protein [bacterium]
MKMHNLKEISFNKQGFTLAEVLVTLFIIGVIAAMSIPVAIKSTEKMEYVSALRKAHSVLSQSLYTIARNNGYPIGDYTFFNDENFMDEFAQVTNIIKKCQTTNECMGSDAETYQQMYTQLNGSPATDLTSGKTVITADGIMYTFAEPSGTFGLSESDIANRLGRIVVDINGSRAPNRYGRDTFFFYIVNGKGLVPAGHYAVNDCFVGSSGRTCAAKVIQESAMKY